MTGQRRPGRPPKAAQSLEEALRRLAAGERPPRPRNEHERAVFGGRRGRKAEPMSKAAQAGQLAAYLAAQEGLSPAEAARLASAAYGVHVDTARKYARRHRDPAKVEVRRQANTWAGPMTQTAVVPLLHSVTDVGPESD